MIVVAIGLAEPCSINWLVFSVTTLLYDLVRIRDLNLLHFSLWKLSGINLICLALMAESNFAVASTGWGNRITRVFVRLMGLLSISWALTLGQERVIMKWRRRLTTHLLYFCLPQQLLNLINPPIHLLRHLIYFLHHFHIYRRLYLHFLVNDSLCLRFYNLLLSKLLLLQLNHLVVEILLLTLHRFQTPFRIVNQLVKCSQPFIWILAHL